MRASLFKLVSFLFTKLSSSPTEDKMKTKPQIQCAHSSFKSVEGRHFSFMWLTLNLILFVRFFIFI